MAMSSETVAANVRAEMGRARVTQVVLAQALGISQASMSGRLRGLIPWRVDEVAATAAALGVPFADLVREREAVA